MTPGEISLFMMFLFLICGGILFIRAKDPGWKQTREFLREPLWYIIIGMGSFVLCAVNVCMYITNHTGVDQVAWSAFFGMCSFVAFVRLYHL